MTFVPRIAGAVALGAAMLVGCGLSSPPAQAGYIVTLTQEGPNVVANGAGTIDTAGLTFVSSNVINVPGIVPSFGVIITGLNSPEPQLFYTGFIGPTSFGSGFPVFPPDSGSGDAVGIAGNPNDLFVPFGYVSGSALLSSLTYDNQTFSSLGATPGTYVWTWGSGATADSFTLQIGPVAVPEPSSLALLALPFGFVMLLAARHRRSRAYNIVKN